MKYLADENLPLETIRQLKTNGIDILSIKEIAPGAADEEVLSISVKPLPIALKDYKEYIKQVDVFLDKVGMLQNSTPD